MGGNVFDKRRKDADFMVQSFQASKQSKQDLLIIKIFAKLSGCEQSFLLTSAENTPIVYP